MRSIQKAWLRGLNFDLNFTNFLIGKLEIWGSSWAASWGQVGHLWNTLFYQWNLIILTFGLGLQNFLDLNRTSWIRSAHCHIVFCPFTKTVLWHKSIRNVRETWCAKHPFVIYKMGKKREKIYWYWLPCKMREKTVIIFFTLVRCGTQTPCKDQKHLKRENYAGTILVFTTREASRCTTRGSIEFLHVRAKKRGSDKFKS